MYKSDIEERRYINRLILPDAKIYFRRFDRFNPIRHYQGPVDLADISKSALRVYGLLPCEKKNRLQIKLVIPGCPDISVKCWLKNFDEKNATTVLQFLPFGMGRNYNSFRTKQQLEMLLHSDLLYFSHLTVA